jgi:hypothetical protein
MSARSPLLAAVAAACLAAPAAAQDKPNLAGTKFGRSLVGPTIETDGLKGHAVVIEYWGAR